MSQTHQEISEVEFKTLSSAGNRVTVDSRRPSESIYLKIINHKLILQGRPHLPTGYRIVELIFKSCIFNEEINIGLYESAGRVKFINCTFNNAISINLENSSYDGKCIFNSNLTIRSSSDVSVSELVVNGDLTFIVSNASLTLQHINEGVQISNQNVFIKSASNILLLTKIFAKKLGLSGLSDLRNDFILTDVHVEEIDIHSIVLNTEMKIDDSTISKLQIKRVYGDEKRLAITNSKLDEIDLTISQLKNTSILQCSVVVCKLTDANGSDDILNIEKSKINRLEFNNLYNKGIITLRELEIASDGLVSFKATNLGKADFIYCNFSKARLEFENSKITEAFFSETEFPKKVFVNGIINHGQAQLAFGQLANAFLKQGDNIRSLEYSSREIEAHYKNLYFFSSDFFRKFNLWLNFVSNNFGRDWVRGILFSFCIGLTFFFLLLISTDNYEVGMPTLEINLLPAYLKFMNPLRFFELEAIFKDTAIENSIKLKPSSYLADFGGRIFITYGYYQTIQAFRKFGRK